MRKKYYLTLDTETCTLPFADSICKNATEKQKIAIAKPLIYDIGWVITDRKGEIIKKENYLVQETFFVPTVFNTAYYKEKRPIYMSLLEKGEIKVLTWNEITKILKADLDSVDLVTAYNACFDFKKAIPFTENYIKALYSNDYNGYEERQRKNSLAIIKGKNESHNEKYLTPIFEFKGNEYPIADLWGVACSTLINNERYKKYCMKNKLFTNSVKFFKTSAETTFQYITQNFDFIESHTALDDALIESQILTKALKKGKVQPQIKEFPFRDLGTTIDFAQNHTEYLKVVFNALEEYCINNNAFEKSGGYWRNVQNSYGLLYNMINQV